VLHSSWTGIVLSVAGTALLAGLAVFAVAAAGLTVISGGLVVMALAAAGVILFDMPIAAAFDSAGVTRRTPLRRHRVSWDDVDRLSRVRTGFLRPTKVAPTGGLLAVRGRRNITLVDRMEGHVEFLHLRSALGDQGERLGIDRIATPPLGQPPTWTHRRRRWRPSTPADR
jgi:hypothetical protein